MQKVTSKRQITLPKDLCSRAGINPGDPVEIFEHEGWLTVVKKQKGAAAGALKHLRSNPALVDEESLLDEVQQKNDKH